MIFSYIFLINSLFEFTQIDIIEEYNTKKIQKKKAYESKPNNKNRQKYPKIRLNNITLNLYVQYLLTKA